MEDFYTNMFFPFLRKHKITRVIHPGDLVDRRKYINILTLHTMRKCFVEPMKEFEFHIIPGNHDCYHKNNNTVNALDEFLPEGMFVYHQPSEVVIGGRKVLMLPWMAPENEQQCIDAVNHSTADILFGHLNLKGFEMHRGSVSEDGHDMGFLSKFTHVYTGHFHHKSTMGNITYLGTPYEMTWSDYADPKGFHIWDTDTLQLEFIENPKKLFNKIEFKDEDITAKELAPLKNTYVKLVVESKQNLVLLDKIISRIEALPVNNLAVIDNTMQIDLDAAEDDISQAESTLDILVSSVKHTGIRLELEGALEACLRRIHSEASLVQL
jgi:DNA repair exonuclease SbcCD nuclease subunit